VPRGLGSAVPLRRGIDPELAATGSDRDTPPASQNASGQEEDRLQKKESSTDGDSQDPKWEKKQPHDGVQKKRQQGQRPAHDEKQNEEQKSGHSGSGYGSRRRKVQLSLFSLDPQASRSRAKISGCPFSSIAAATVTSDSKDSS